MSRYALVLIAPCLFVLGVEAFASNGPASRGRSEAVQPSHELRSGR